MLRSLCAALCSVCLVSTTLLGRAAAQQPAARGDLHVLSIGVEPQLSAKGKHDVYAQDAAFVADALAAAKPVFRKVVPTVVNGKQATRHNVLAALGRLKTRVRAQDVAVVFFSAHGSIASKGGYRISLARGPKGESQVINGTELFAAASAVPGKVVIMLDTCCAAGAIPSQNKAPNVAFITACRRKESSFGQSEHKKRPHGYFVIALCEGLKGLADKDKDGTVTVRELEIYISKRATELCDQQHAVSRTPGDLVGLALAQVGKNPQAERLHDFNGKRNPFGLPDVDRPLGEDIRTFAQKTRVPGGDKDDNAKTWNQEGAQGKPDTLEGDWEYRWRGANADDNWVTGVAQIKIANDRVFLLCRDSSGKYLIEGRRGQNERIVGRYVNLSDPGDNGPFVARSISPERIDGYWASGRWDFRRTVGK